MKATIKLLDWTILVDKMEKQPWMFRGFKGDAKDQGKELLPRVEFKALGTGMGDYSVKGHEGEIHIERKSQEDAYGTFLGWSKRRDRFIRELKALSEIRHSWVIVECGFETLVRQSPETDNRTAAENAKTLLGQIPAWMSDYNVKWMFMQTRRNAELFAFKLMRRFVENRRKQEKLIDSI